MLICWKYDLIKFVYKCMKCIENKQIMSKTINTIKQTKL